MKTTIKSIFKPWAVAAAACGAVLAIPNAARATPHTLPFNYPYETLPERTFEFEFYTDVNPLRVNADPTDPTKGRLWEPMYQLQTEFEYGLTDRVELAFYQVFEANPQDGGTNTMTFDGLKWRVRTRLAEAGEWPVDVSLYFELETMHDELALEEKINLQRRFGRLLWLGNLWVEEEWERPFDGGDAEFVINPTTGFSYQVTPMFHPGIEYWARGQIVPEGETDQDRANNRVHHFIGPTMHWNFGKFWWSLGAYVHLSSTRVPEPGDAYGPFWIRSLLGVEL